MANKLKKKRRMKKAIVLRQKEISKIAFEMAWKNYWIKVGVLNG